MGASNTMNTLLILGHQRPGSFCHAIAKPRWKNLCAAGHEVVFHDLYAEGFDPILPDAEIPKDPNCRRPSPGIAAKWSRPMPTWSCIPNWWAMPPAILKGWLDRVFRQGVVYEFGPQGVIGKLKGKRAIVFTTSNTPREDELRLFGDPLENLWKTCVFGFCGLEDFYRRNFESIVMSTPQQRAGWLEEVRQIVRSAMRKQFTRSASGKRRISCPTSIAHGKEALDLFFEAFLELFFPQAHADIDWSQGGGQSLDKELQQIVRPRTFWNAAGTPRGRGNCSG